MNTVCNVDEIEGSAVMDMMHHATPLANSECAE